MFFWFFSETLKYEKFVKNTKTALNKENAKKYDDDEFVCLFEYLNVENRLTYNFYENMTLNTSFKNSLSIALSILSIITLMIYQLD